MIPLVYSETPTGFHHDTLALIFAFISGVKYSLNTKEYCAQVEEKLQDKL